MHAYILQLLCCVPGPCQADNTEGGGNVDISRCYNEWYYVAAALMCPTFLQVPVVLLSLPGYMHL